MTKKLNDLSPEELSEMYVVSKLAIGYYDTYTAEYPHLKEIEKELTTELENTFRGSVAELKQATIDVKVKAKELHRDALKIYQSHCADMEGDLAKENGMENHPKRKKLYDYVCAKSDSRYEIVDLYEELVDLMK